MEQLPDFAEMHSWVGLGKWECFKLDEQCPFWGFRVVEIKIGLEGNKLALIRSCAKKTIKSGAVSK